MCVCQQLQHGQGECKTAMLLGSSRHRQCCTSRKQPAQTTEDQAVQQHELLHAEH